MGAILIPPWIIPEKEDYEFVDDDTSVFRPALAAGLTQRVQHGSVRLRISRSHTVRQDELGMIGSTLMDADGSLETIYTRVHYSNRGSFPAAELLPNPTFASTTATWSATPSTEIALTVGYRMLRTTRVAVNTIGSIQAGSVAVTSGGFYAAAAYIREGRGVISATGSTAVRIGTSAGGNQIGTTLVSTQSLHQAFGVMTTNAGFYSLADDPGAKSAGGFFDITHTSFSRAIMVDAGGQTGSALTVARLPNSETGLLLPFDWFSINGELKMVTAPLNSNGSGQGYVRFKPALFRSPNSGTPLIVLNPFGRFTLSNYKMVNRFGTDAVVSYDLEQIDE